MTRLISHSEVDSLLNCNVQHAFAYTGHLTGGDALKPRTTALLLREGRAWGAGVAAWHETQNRGDAVLRGLHAMFDSLGADAEQQQAAGTYDEAEHAAAVTRLGDMLRHYASTATWLPIDRLEHEIITPIPSRGGVRKSNRYALQARFDGIHVDADGRTWLVEFKFRKRLSALAQIALARQIRWYAWAYRESTGRDVAGVIVDERLNDLPKPVRLNKDGTPSKVQGCTPEAYEAAGGTDQDVLDGLRAKVWQARHEVMFRPGELDEAGLQLASAARLVQQLDSGALYPIRNPSPMRCPGCAFRDICPDPAGMADVIDLAFERVAPKRNRGPLPQEIAA